MSGMVVLDERVAIPLELNSWDAFRSWALSDRYARFRKNRLY